MPRLPFFLVLGSLAACSGQQEPSRPIVTLSPKEVDQACILSAGDELRRQARLEGRKGRALPAPPAPGAGGGDRAGERLVEIEATDTGLPVTYVFACVVEDGQAYVRLVGRK